MLRSLFPAAVLLSLAITTAQAVPMTPAVEVASVNVTYGDLNLSDSRDAAVLADRLQLAAKEVCLKTNDAKATVRKILMRRCMDLAVSKATSHIWSQIEASPNRAIRANLATVRQQIASVETP